MVVGKKSSACGQLITASCALTGLQADPDFGNNLPPWSAHPFSLPRYTSLLKNWDSKGIRKYCLDLDGSLEAARLHLIVSEAFFNNWADFLFVENLVTRSGQITSFPAGTHACR
jgi:hypothetical protein